jgi:hypothetical protein
MEQPELWIGLVELKPLQRAAHDAAGAFTNIVTWASDIGEFRAKSEVIAAILDQYVIDVEQAEPLAERASKSELTEEVADMVLRAESNPEAIVYGTFHRYPFNEA